MISILIKPIKEYGRQNFDLILGRAFALPKAFHWDLTTFPISTHHCAVAELKKKLKQIRLGSVAE